MTKNHFNISKEHMQESDRLLTEEVLNPNPIAVSPNFGEE